MWPLTNFYNTPWKLVAAKSSQCEQAPPLAEMPLNRGWANGWGTAGYSWPSPSAPHPPHGESVSSGSSPKSNSILLPRWDRVTGSMTTAETNCYSLESSWPSRITWEKGVVPALTLQPERLTVLLRPFLLALTSARGCNKSLLGHWALGGEEGQECCNWAITACLSGHTWAE